MKLWQILSLHLAALSLLLVPACAPTGGGSGSGNSSDQVIEEVFPGIGDNTSPPPGVSPVDPNNIQVPLDSETDVLLFNGVGISTSDWQSTERIVKEMGLSYQLVNSSQLNAMTLEDLIKFGLIIVPGGSRGSIMSGLTNTAQLIVRKAVRDHGVSYLGFCAGSFAAVGTLANGNTVSENDLAVIYGKHLSNWWPNGQHITAAMVKVDFADNSSRWLVWWGGPATPEWSGGVVARYDDGKPAISQGWSNKGFVVLTGPHPEAPQGWRATAGNDPDGLDFELTKNLITSALNRKPMPAF